MSRLNHLTTSSKRTWRWFTSSLLPRGTNVLTPKVSKTLRWKLEVGFPRILGPPEGYRLTASTWSPAGGCFGLRKRCCERARTETGFKWIMISSGHRQRVLDTLCGYLHMRTTPITIGRRGGRGGEVLEEYSLFFSWDIECANVVCRGSEIWRHSRFMDSWQIDGVDWFILASISALSPLH